MSIHKKQDKLIAIIGMSGRFPGANSLSEFWDNIIEGKEVLSRYTNEELQDNIDDVDILDNPEYVKTGGLFKDQMCFDPGFFGMTPKEAEVSDPQIRVFLECSWEALEDACCSPEKFKGRIGVFGGTGLNSYLLNNLYTNKHIYLTKLNLLQTAFLNDKDYLATHTSHKLNLKGPSFTVQTACSTSLVAVNLACQSLLNGNCEAALAGGINIQQYQKQGYLYQEGNLFSPDGKCRVFDEKANGTVFTNGAGVIVLKKLEQAINDNDRIYAVIRGSALNNDGKQKVGFIAPSFEGQVDVIQRALADAHVKSSEVGYIEAHGTGTVTGDAIELRALNEIYSKNGDEKSPLYINSVKANIGHTLIASGVIGLIKTALVLQEKKIPPAVQFQSPNPILLAGSTRLKVITTPKKWIATDKKRIAGISSFGIGGTNCHLILEEWQNEHKQESHVKNHLFTVSVKSKSALQDLLKKYSSLIDQKPTLSCEDLAYSQWVGRNDFQYRLSFPFSSISELGDILKKRSIHKMMTHCISESEAVFLFPGQGSQYLNMGKGLFEQNHVFRDTIKKCCAIAEEIDGTPLLEYIYPVDRDKSSAIASLNNTIITQPAIFIMEYALAKTLEVYGVFPSVMIGHSVGEFVAAVLAGVFSFNDALKLVIARGKILQKIPEGGMLAIYQEKSKVEFLLDTSPLSIASINTPSACVVSGKHSEIECFKEVLDENEIAYKDLHTSHAFHSYMMEPAIKEFLAVLETIDFHHPTKKILSCVTGNVLTDSEVTDVKYWANHMRNTVDFYGAVRALKKQKNYTFIEVGPGKTLSSFVRQIRNNFNDNIESVCRHPKESLDDYFKFLECLGYLWQWGIQVDFFPLYSRKNVSKISLPSYPFSRREYYVKPYNGKNIPIYDKKNMKNLFYTPSWQISHLLDKKNQISDKTWLFFMDQGSAGNRIITGLKKQTNTSAADQQFIKIYYNKEFCILDKHVIHMDYERQEDYLKLFAHFKKLQIRIDHIVHLSIFRNLSKRDTAEESLKYVNKMGVLNILYLAQEIKRIPLTHDITFTLVTKNFYSVTSAETTDPAASLLKGFILALNAVVKNLTLYHIDVDRIDNKFSMIDKVSICLMSQEKQTAVFRNGYHWTLNYELTPIKKKKTPQIKLQKNGVYLITGGLGGLGYTFSKYLAEKFKSRLAICGTKKISWNNGAALKEFIENDSDLQMRIDKLKKLEQLGAEVLYYNCDLKQRQSVKSTYQDVLNHFGKINGIFHTAGVASQGVVEMDHDSLQRVFLPKTYGSVYLLEEINLKRIDFVVLFSSISVLTGGFKDIDYISANSYLDALAHQYYSQIGTKIFSVNWDLWQQVGMGVNQDYPDEFKSWMSRMMENAINPEEGLEAFERIIASEYPQVVVTKNSLIEILEHNDTDNQKKQKAKAENDNSEVYTHYSETEKKVLFIWKDILGNNVIGKDEHFLEIGGHSFTAIQVLSRLNSIFDLKMEMHVIFNYPTISEISLEIERLIMDKNGVEVKKTDLSTGPAAKDFLACIPPSQQEILKQMFTIKQLQNTYDYIYPLTDQQMSVLFHSIFRSYSNVHQKIIILGKEIKMKIIGRAWSFILEHHSILRSSYFLLNDQSYVNLILKNDNKFNIYSERYTQDLILQDKEKVFDLNNGPLTRMGLLDRKNEPPVLLWSYADVLLDGLSTNLIIDDLFYVYKAMLSGNKEISLQNSNYWNYINWYTERDDAEARKVWEEIFACIDKSKLKQLRIKNWDKLKPMQRCSCLFTQHEKAAIEAFLTESKITLNTLFSAFWAKVLSDFHRIKTIIIGLNTSGRSCTHYNLSRTAGMFSNIIPLPINIPENTPIINWLQWIQTQIIKVLDYNYIHAKKISQWTGIDYIHFRQAILHNSLSVYNYTKVKKTDLNEYESFSLLQEDVKTIELPLRMHVDVNDTIQISITYTDELYSTTNIEQLMKKFSDQIKEVIQDNIFDQRPLP